ncbi:MAG: hypothetical protein P4K86_09330 [Terracidiphilus sp.]|nr:hypothetical protein [Terracidiphilus sp.]
MIKRYFLASLWTSVCLVLAVAMPAAVTSAQDLGGLTPAPPAGKHAHAVPAAPKPSLPPAFTIPVEPLGYSAPGALYLGQLYTLTSLDFLDENRLLFTFRVPGLIHREHGAGSDEDSDEHHMRALVLDIPSGSVRAEAVWTLHDRARYLSMLKDGHFLLRDGDSLQQGDATLTLKPILRFPGPLLTVEVDPTQQFLVTNSREPLTVTPKPSDDSSRVPSPATAAANVTVDGQKPDVPADTVVRILHRDTGQVMLVGHVPSTIHLPINADGYLESLRARDGKWLINLNAFTGGSTQVGKVDSTCSPLLEFIGPREVLASTCNGWGEFKLVAMTLDGRRLWEKNTPATQGWPRLVMAPNGSRLARETLTVSHPIDASHPFSKEDIKGQVVEVFDAANGQIVLTAPASPPLDAGGNVGISPSGRRVAVLNGGEIQVFDLPAPPPLPDSSGSQPRR